MTKRSIVTRGILLAVYVAIGIWAYSTGKGYKIFVDNTDPSIAGAITVAIDGATPVRVRLGGYTGIMVKGTGSHRIKIMREGAADFVGEFKFPPKSTAAALTVSGIKPGSEILVVPVDPDTRDR